MCHTYLIDALAFRKYIYIEQILDVSLKYDLVVTADSIEIMQS